MYHITIAHDDATLRLRSTSLQLHADSNDATMAHDGDTLRNRSTSLQLHTDSIDAAIGHDGVTQRHRLSRLKLHIERSDTAREHDDVTLSDCFSTSFKLHMDSGKVKIASDDVRLNEYGNIVV